jgi:DNA primase
MRFPPSFLDEVRARLPVSEVVGRRVKLRKHGREFIGLSPFNQEKTPSFTVNDQKGFYHDFSSGKHGDIFTFLMETEGLSFPEAVERLAGIAGVPVPQVSKEAEAHEERRKTLYDVLELAAKFFETNLASNGGTKARDYLAGREIKSTTQREFRLGYALPGRFALKEYLGAQGIPIPDMIAAGLLVAGDEIPVPYDRFRDRIIIPIQDQRGRVIAFGGRALGQDVQPKYLNSPETSVFHKGSIVFNFHRARQAAHDDGSVVAVEGYMDAIAIYQAGLRSVVATMGTSFTEEQIATLWRLSPEPVVCFDADRAGIAAAHRSIDRILPELKVGRAFRFAFIQSEKDPDDLIREKGLDAFKQVLQGSLPILDVLWERELALARVDTPGEQVKLEQKLYSIVAVIKDPIVQRSYKNSCRLQLASLFWQVERGRRRQSKRDRPSKELAEIGKTGHRQGIQKILLGLLVHFPEFIEEKSDDVTNVHFELRLEQFRHALYDLLIMYKEVSVQLIYDKLTDNFYDVLQDIHGDATKDKQRGHRLLRNFPVLKVDPPQEFISRCIDHFIRILLLEQMAEEIDGLVSAADENPAEWDGASEHLMEVVRHYHEQREVVNKEDVQLAEDAKEIKRAALGPTEYRVMAPESIEL